MKKEVHGIKFRDEQEVKDTILGALHDTDEAVFSHELKKLLSLCDKVGQNDGGHVTPY